LVLLLPFARPALFKLLDAAGHGELLILSGLFFALAMGYEAFTLVGLKGDLGALVMGVMVASHPKASELSKSLFSFKELMLVGFFLSVGLQGLPTAEIFAAAALLCLLLPIKTLLYYWIVVRFGLRARTSVFSALALANYSEFGLIVAALGVSQGWLPVDWLLVIAIAVSLSFAIAAPFSQGAEPIYQRFKGFWDRYQRETLHPEDRLIDIGEARALVIGMGRVGLGAYEALREAFDGQIVGIEHDAKRVQGHQQEGRSVLLGDATDTDFWTKLQASSNLELIVLAMPAHHSNLYAAQRIRKANLVCHVVAVAHFSNEVEELALLKVPAFNMYSEAGSGLARHALDSMQERPLTRSV
jgi:Kef-type K+ transport system membrane component KefB